MKSSEIPKGRSLLPELKDRKKKRRKTKTTKTQNDTLNTKQYTDIDIVALQKQT